MTNQIIDNKEVRGAKKLQKFLKISALMLFSLGIGSNVMASEPQVDHHVEATEHGENHDEVKQEFNAGKMIMEHISDAHDWHLFDYNGHAVSIPLPVIIYNSENGVDIFMSSKFEHGHAEYKGYKLEEGKVVLANESSNASITDLSITKNVAAIMVSVLLLLIVFMSVAKSYGKRKQSAPKGLQAVIEPLIVFLRDEVVKPSIGKKYERYMPFLLTVFFFIFFNNLLGLIPIAPGGANVTGNIAVTMVLALLVLIITTVIGNKHYWKHIFLPDVPFWLYPILIPIEIVGVFIKPFVLMLRLFANITAGHIILLGFLSLIFIFGQMALVGGYGAAVFSVAFSLFMSLLEILVAFLQAYVFTLLSALYFGAATEEHH